MKKIINVVSSLLMLTISGGMTVICATANAQATSQQQADSPTTEPMSAGKSAAIDELLSVTHFKEYWPEVIRQLYQKSKENIRKQSMQALSTRPELTEKQRQEYSEFVDANLTVLTDQAIEEALRIDIAKVSQVVKVSFYGKYFTEAEIRVISEKFNTPVWQKFLRVQARIIEEARRTGFPEARAKFLSHGELIEIDQIAQTPAVEKVFALTPKLVAEVMPIITNMTDIDKLRNQADVYLAKTGEKLRSFPPTQSPPPTSIPVKPVFEVKPTTSN